MRKLLIKNNRGFTLIEFMAAIAVGTVLSLTAGLMLYYSSVTWNNNSVFVELQRDGTFIMDMLSRKIRPLTVSDIDVPDPTRQLIPSIRVGNESIYFDEDTNSIYRDLDIGMLGEDILIIDQTVTAVTFTNDVILQSVGIDIILQNEDKTISINSTILYRN